MSTLTPQGTFQTIAPAEPPMTGPAEPPKTAAPAEPPMTGPAEPPKTAAPAEPPKTAAPAELPQVAATTKTPLPADTARCGSEISSPDADALKERKAGRKSPLTKQQQDFVRSKFPKWEEILRENELHLGKKEAHMRDPEEVTQWIEKTINEIRTSSAFEGFNDTSAELTKILKVMFRNYRNNTFIKKNKHAILKKAITNKQVSLDSTDADAPKVDDLKADALKAAEALASFKNPAPAKEIFREENDERIKQEAERLRTEAAEKRAAEGKNPDDFDSRKDDNRGGFYQRALTALWKQADQALYKEKANSYDLYSNQEEFPRVMRTALEALCQHGALGPTEIFLMAGFRNAKNEPVICRMTCHHKDGQNQPGFLRSKGEERESAMLTRRWYDYCSAHLPKNDVEETSCTETYITTNDDAIPVLVDFNLRDLKPSQLCEVLKTFLSTLWFHSWPQDKEQPSIPLLEIIEHPEDFYDTEKYKFPVAFAEIETLHPGDLYNLAEYLLSKSSAACRDPFVFWNKQDIRERLASRRRLKALELSTGEEIVSCDAIQPQLTPLDHLVSLPTFKPLPLTVEELPAASREYQTNTVCSSNPEEPGAQLSAAETMPSREPTTSTEPMPSIEPTPPTASDIMPVSDAMDTTPEDTPLVSTDFVAPNSSDVAPAGQQFSPSSDVTPITLQNTPPPDAPVDPHSPNSPNSPSSGASTLPDTGIPNPAPMVIPDSSSSPVAVPVAVNSSSESQPTRQSRRGGRKKTVGSGGVNAGSSNPVNVTAVATDLRRSSRAKGGKRGNPVPDPGQRPAKRAKRQPKGYVYIAEDSEGNEIVVDENGQFVEMLHQHAK
ncbi:hypothetical protein FB446DRAFT_825070 [Lentinula raphanica]|nr:hypothetical protein FB446DRAFT_825070 [Lentinula raphanica]